MTTIAEVPFAAVQPFASRASREHVSISNTRSTRWFAALAGGRIVGIAGLLKFATGLRVKGVWVDPDFRGKGIGNDLATRLIEVAEHECAPAIEAFAWRPDYYEGRGFERCGALPNGAIRVRKRL
jgi:N-acetylglutamate synthase-like GNAT family acetyltransferase